MNPRHKTILQMRDGGATWFSIAKAFAVSSPRIQEIYREQKAYQDLIALHPIVALLRKRGHKMTAARIATLFQRDALLSAASLARLGGRYVLSQPGYGRTLAKHLAGALETMGLIEDQELWINN